MQLIAFALGIAAPIIYLIVAQSFTRTASTDAAVDMIFYILLVLGAIQPAVAPVIAKVQLGQYRRSVNRMAPGKMFINLLVVRLALVEAIFTYGLMIAFMTGDFNRMLWFYPIGAIWMLIYWPRKEKYVAFIEEMETNVNRA